VNSPKYESKILDIHFHTAFTWDRDHVDPSDLPDEDGRFGTVGHIGNLPAW
jgi:hypothetical protein